MTFLELRSAELRPGGRLVVVLPVASGDGCSGFETIMDHVSAVLASVVGNHAIAADEREYAELAVWPRHTGDLLAPFAGDGQFHGLTVEHCETVNLQDAAWAAYMRDGDSEALARARAAFFRSTFAPSVACALAAGSDPHTVRAFVEEIEQGVTLRLASHAAPINCLISTIVLAKQKTTRGRLVCIWSIE